MGAGILTHKVGSMPNKSDTGGQPSLEKLQAEGVSPRKCIASEGMPGYGGNGGSKTAGNQGSKPAGAFAQMRKGRGY